MPEGRAFCDRFYPVAQGSKSSVLQSPMHLRQGQALERLGLCNYQVPGDLKSSNEGAQLDLLTGANRKPVPGEDSPKLNIRHTPGPACEVRMWELLQPATETLELTDPPWLALGSVSSQVSPQHSLSHLIEAAEDTLETQHQQVLSCTPSSLFQQREEGCMG